MAYDIRPCTIDDVARLCAAHHGYASAGDVAVCCQGVYEGGRVVAAFAWQPPPAGAAKSACPEVPGGVLSLSRMVAVPKDERALRHISKPLRIIMRHVIDRTRWPVLITYSDESLGHLGYVYKCSGWQPERDTKGNLVRRSSASYENADGQRVSAYSAGKSRAATLVRIANKITLRWAHQISPTPLAYMTDYGWEQVPIPGKVWRSGKQAHTWTNLYEQWWDSALEREEAA